MLLYASVCLCLETKENYFLYFSFKRARLFSVNINFIIIEISEMICTAKTRRHTYCLFIFSVGLLPYYMFNAINVYVK